MAMAVTNGAMAMTVMERRLLDERRAVGMNASQRDGIRSARRTQCDDSESRCGEDRLHDVSLLERAASRCNLPTLLHCVRRAGRHPDFVPPNAGAVLRINSSTLSRNEAEGVLTLW